MADLFQSYQKKRLLSGTTEQQDQSPVANALRAAILPGVQGQGSTATRAAIAQGSESFARQAANQRSQAGQASAGAGLLGQGAAIQRQDAAENQISQNLTQKLLNDAQLKGADQKNYVELGLTQANREMDSEASSNDSYLRMLADLGADNPVLQRSITKDLVGRAGVQLPSDYESQIAAYEQERKESPENVLAKTLLERQIAEAKRPQFDLVDVQSAAPADLQKWANNRQAIEGLKQNPDIQTITDRNLLAAGSQHFAPGEAFIYGEKLYQFVGDDYERYKGNYINLTGSGSRSRHGTKAIDLATGQQVTLWASDRKGTTTFGWDE